MRAAFHAILAASAILMIAGPLHANVLAAAELRKPPKPVSVQFHLADGVRVSGELTGWNADEIDGSFGRRRWMDLRPDDIWGLRLRLMDTSSAAHWIELGRTLLLAGASESGASELAERAFRRALGVDPGAAGLIQAAREEVEAITRQSRQAEQQAREAQLNTILPEGQTWPADPWPQLNESEQAGAIAAMASEAAAIVDRSGIKMLTVQTDQVMLQTDAARAEAARWAVLLHKTIHATQRELGDDAGEHFRGVWGKLAVVVFTKQDDFRQAEAESFRQLVARNTVALCHSSGPRSFVLAWRCDDPHELEWMLVREAVHATMHRWRTPRRLPAWANEGLADHVAGIVLKQSPLASERRDEGLRYLRNQAAPEALFELQYADQSHPGPSGPAAPAGALIIELLLRAWPGEFIQWLNAVKDGSEWRAALEQHLRTVPERLMLTAVKYYRVND